LIRITSFVLAKSPMSLTQGDEVPHVLTRKSRLQPAEFLITSAKRLLQQNRHNCDMADGLTKVCYLGKSERQAPQKKSGPPTDASATNFVRSTQAHGGLQCPELAQLRPQIVPWSTLCLQAARRPPMARSTRGSQNYTRPNFWDCVNPAYQPRIDFYFFSILERRSYGMIGYAIKNSDDPRLAAS
jgi:hypothetical protein